MANTINAYDADVRIPQFLGLKQYGDLMNGNPVYAEHAVNMNTKGGVLMPMAKPTTLPGEIVDDAGNAHPIETLMCVNRRQYRDQILVAAANNHIYTYKEDRWEQAEMPEGWSIFASNTWSWVDYEYTETVDNEEGETHDVILFSNAYDGMFMLDSVTDVITAVDAPAMFGVIERSNERIWGSGVTEDPDSIYYSKPYNPLDWDPVPDIPADGGGVIDQPSWDGDEFTTLKAFGDQIIAFKRKRVWRIVGTNPEEYVFKEQYGGGAIAAKTVAVDSSRIYMLGRDGVYVYDGNAVEPFGKEYAYSVFRRMNIEHIDEACACIFGDKYYLAVPLDDSTTNNAVITYDLHDGTWLLRRDLQVESWLPTETALYFTTVDDPYKVNQYHENAWESGTAIDEDAVWTSPWNDLGYPHKNKGPFVFLFTPEVQDTPADFTVTIDTDKKSRSKDVRVYPLKGYEQRMTREAKVVRIPFAGNGRRFRFSIAAKGGAVWRICGGVVIRVDQETEE